MSGREDAAGCPRQRLPAACPLHEGAPRYLDSVIKSLNTPAAVTAGPAPGPRTINGGLLQAGGRRRAGDESAQLPGGIAPSGAQRRLCKRASFADMPCTHATVLQAVQRRRHTCTASW